VASACAIATFGAYSLYAHFGLRRRLGRVAAALLLFTPTECRNDVAHCGYRLAVQL